MSAPMSIGIESVSWSRWSQECPAAPASNAWRGATTSADVRFFATPPIDGSISRHVAIEAAFAPGARGPHR